MFVQFGASTLDEASFGKMIFEEFGKSELVDDETSKIGEDEKSYRVELKKEDLDQKERNGENLIPAPTNGKNCKLSCFSTPKYF